MQAVSVTILLVAALSTSALADETTPIRRADMRDLKASATYVGGDVPLKLSNVMDGVAYSSWAGGTQGKEGVWISVHFAGTRYISQVELLPGCAGSNRVYGLFGRPRSLELVSGGRTVTLQVKDKRRTQVFQIDPPLAATRLKINAGNHYPGRLPAVCLTELQLHEQTALGSLDSATRQRLEIHASALGAEDASAAIVGLVAMGPAAVPRLAVALREADPLTQERALTALHRIGAPSAAMPLMRYWQAGPPTDLRKLTIKALARTGHDAVIPLIAEIMKGDDYELANQAAATVGSFGKAMLPALEPLLKSPFADVVERTVRAMRHIGDMRVVALATPFCRARRSDHRAAAAEALASSPCEASTVELRKLADDKHPHVRFAVAKSLDVYPDADSTLILARLLRDTDPYVANKALDVLANKTQGLRHLAAYISSDHAPLGK
ncbi:MAG: HEAT repeat protein, partial [Myxococcota bacterium]